MKMRDIDKVKQREQREQEAAQHIRGDYWAELHRDVAEMDLQRRVPKHLRGETYALPL